MSTSKIPSEAWHLSPAYVRHLCGSPERVKLAAPDAAPPRGPSSFNLEEAEVFPGVTIEAPPLAAPVAAFVQTRKAEQDREKIYAAIREGHATRAEISKATGLYLHRVIDLTREDEDRGILTRLPSSPGRPASLLLVVRP